MKRIVYLVMAASFFAGCGNGKEKNPKAVNPAPAVNISDIKVSEVVGIGKIQPEKEIISLSSYTGGIIVEVLKNDGDLIRKDEPLLRLDDQLEQIRIAQLKARIRTQQTQTGLEEIALVEAQLKLQNKIKLLASAKALTKNGAETVQNLDDLDTEVKMLDASVKEGMASVCLSQNRSQELSEEMKLAMAEAERKILRSPFDGTLLEMHVRKGSAIGQFGTYADIAPAGNRIVVAEVDELFAGRLKEGMSAEIRYVGGDSAIASGKLFFLSPFLKRKSLFSDKTGEQEDRYVREVKISLNGSNELILNTKVECVIKL